MNKSVKVGLLVTDYDRFCNIYGKDIKPFDINVLTTIDDTDIVIFGWNNINKFTNECLNEFLKSCRYYKLLVD